MSCYPKSRGVMTSDIVKCEVLPQVRGNTKRASGLVVMTSRLQRGDRLFDSGLAHYSLVEFQCKNTGFFRGLFLNFSFSKNPKCC